jgi:hypothetical protein
VTILPNALREFLHRLMELSELDGRYQKALARLAKHD